MVSEVHRSGGPTGVCRGAPTTRTARAPFHLARLNEVDFVNYSSLSFTNGSVLASSLRRSAGTRRSRISQANRGKGGDHICAFS